MKIILVLFCLVGAATCQLSLPPEDLRKVMQYNAECQKQSGATQQEIMATLKGTFSDSPALKEHVLCLGLKMQFLTEDGQILTDNVRTKMVKVIHDEAAVDDMMKKCILQRNNPADTAYDSIKCFSDNRKMVLKA